MSKGKFVQETAITFVSGVLSLFIGVITSVILARVLGPEGRGIYALAVLLPSLIVTFGNLGIGPATVYYVARGEFRREEILGNNILLSIGIGGAGILAGLMVVHFSREALFPNVPPAYLLLALALVPGEIFFSYVNYVLLGAQRIKEFNYRQVLQSTLFLGFITLGLLVLKGKVREAILFKTKFFDSFRNHSCFYQFSCHLCPKPFPECSASFQIHHPITPLGKHHAGPAVPGEPAVKEKGTQERNRVRGG